MADLEEADGPGGRRARAQEPRALREGARHRGPPRDRPRPRGLVAAPCRPRAQGDDHPARGRRSGRHLSAAARGPLSPHPQRARGPHRGAARRPGGRGGRLRRDLHGRAQRPRARHRDGAAHGDAVRDVGAARAHDLRRRPAGPVPQGPPACRRSGNTARRRPAHRRRDPRHHRPDLRSRAQSAHGAEAGAHRGGGRAQAARDSGG